MEQRRTRERGYLEAYLQIAPILLGLCLVVLVGLGRVLAACLRVTTSFRHVLLLGAPVIRLSFLVVLLAFLLMACTVSGGRSLQAMREEVHSESAPPCRTCAGAAFPKTSVFCSSRHWISYDAHVAPGGVVEAAAFARTVSKASPYK
jgi:hypothetical protein